jgi:hypothetical protein
VKKLLKNWIEEMKPLWDFIETERESYEPHDGNLFATSLGQPARYYDFISIVFDRYKFVSKQAVAKHSELRQALSTHGYGALSDEQMRISSEHHQIATLVHLEVESFYLFAKIFLDKTAFFLRDYFGVANEVPLTSHHKLQQNIERLQLAKDLSYPDGFSDTVNFLQNYLIDFRDDEIVHKTNPRTIKGTSYDGEQVSIMRMRIYPNERDTFVESQSLSELMLTLGKYVEQVILVIKMNRDKSRFHLHG